MTTPDALNNVVIMASAGSGKTFQLTNRYLSLLLHHAEPGGVLASTFTRLAAGEIRDRILSRLARAATDDNERASLASFLGAPMTQVETLMMLERLARNLHRLQVRTLDSFFAGIVRCFALELGLDPAAKIVDEDTGLDLRRDAIARMLDETDPQPLIDMLRALTEGQAGRSVTKSIDAAVEYLYEFYRESPPEAWEAVDANPAPLTTKEYTAALDALHDLTSIIEARADIEKDFYNHKSVQKALVKSIEWLPIAQHASSQDWAAFLKSGIAGKIIAGESTFNSRDIPEEVFDRFAPFIEHGRGVCRYAIINRTRSTRDLLARFHQQYEAVKAERKAMTFADLTQRVADAGALGTLDDICFRLDATLRHLLLDEMQDTNIVQWRALWPIVQETLSYQPPERTFFCVGDVKQSIYGWREACPEILESMPALLGIDTRTLAKSYRSSPIIMETVNRVFTDIAENPAMTEYGDAARAWDATFTQHETNQSIPGYAALHVARGAGDGEQPLAVTLEYAADLIETLANEAPGCTIGVLVRTNKAVSKLLYELGPSRRNVDAAGRGGGTLEDSPAVNAILDLLRLADHPEHTIAAFNVMCSPLGRAVGLTSSADGRVDRLASARVARQVRSQILARGYAAMIGIWTRAIGSMTDQRQLRRLMMLQQLAARFEARPVAGGGLRCDDFLAFVNATRIDDPSAAQVQVMTVHQAKGLEFDIVVLPELTDAIVRTNKLPMLYERDGTVGHITRAVRYANKDIIQLFPDLTPMLDQFTTRSARESLCILYVAMTRARQALHMVVPPPSENERTLPKKLASIVRCALTDGEKDDLQPETIAFESGDPHWYRSRPSKTSEAERQEHAQTPLHIQLPADAASHIRRPSAAISASQLKADALRDRLTPANQDARDRGTVIHALFESIEWIEEWRPDRDQLIRLVRDIAPRRGEAWAASQVESFLEMVEQPAIRNALARGQATAGELVLHRELPFARVVDGAIQSGYIDRLVAVRSGSTYSHATILDFKTDRLPDASPAAIAAQAEKHREQLLSYRAAAAEALALPRDTIAMKIAFVQPGAVIDLD
ncbi:MAG TPA: UvrD-helicase domain-containing protein [Phycisphaerales bacterium]|nr:UvrD-helicase domain-containing protein [Phycisphaerales bacterium]